MPKKDYVEEHVKPKNFTTLRNSLDVLINNPFSTKHRPSGALWLDPDISTGAIFYPFARSGRKDGGVQHLVTGEKRFGGDQWNLYYAMRDIEGPIGDNSVTPDSRLVAAHRDLKDARSGRTLILCDHARPNSIKFDPKQSDLIILSLNSKNENRSDLEAALVVAQYRQQQYQAWNQAKKADASNWETRLLPDVSWLADNEISMNLKTDGSYEISATKDHVQSPLSPSSPSKTSLVDPFSTTNKKLHSEEIYELADKIFEDMRNRKIPPNDLER